MDLNMGENAPLPSSIVSLCLEYGTRPKGDVDLSAYLLRSDGRTRDDADMVFYGAPSALDGAVMMDPERRTLRIDTARVPAHVERIPFCLVVENGSARDLGWVKLTTDADVSFRLDTSRSTNAAIIMAEVYRRAGAWKIRAVGQGFDGGLAPLARSYGIVVDDEDTSPATPPKPAPIAEVPPSRVSLKKVTLEKEGRVSLRKGGGAIRALLSWQGRRGGEGDLDLYCFYVLKDGTCGKVYWKDMGRDHAAPWITLSGDSRNAGEETIVLHRPEELRYALFAAYSAVGNGAGSFASYRPRMVLTDQDGSEVTIPLLNPNHTSYWVAISHLSIDREITIEHVETYGKSGRAFIAAEKSPRLHADGSWDVSKGPIEFKRK